MDDLISRQAAIDTVKKLIWLTRDAKDVIAEVIEELPSAQSDIIRCKECKHYDPNDHCYLQGAEADDFCSYAERREE